MINDDFCHALIEKGVLGFSSEINADYKGVDLSGSAYLKYNGVFTINDILKKEDKIVFEVSSIEDGQKRQISSSDITKIDGMEIERIANVYGLHPNSKKRKKSRRRTPEEMALVQDISTAKAPTKISIDLSEFDILINNSMF